MYTKVTTEKHPEILNNFLNTRETTEKLVRHLSTEDSMLQIAEFVSPPKWHLAHTTWFFENFILKRYIEDYNVFHTVFDFLFNSYYQSQGERALRDQRGGHSRPTWQEVKDYRAHVTQKMDEIFQENSNDATFIQLIEVGTNHEKQHQELLLTDLKYSWSISPMNPQLNDEYDVKNDTACPFEWLNIPKGNYKMGRNFDNGFCFDNETPEHEIHLEAFEIANRTVTNREYIEFIQAGGYKDWSLWLDEGWAWVNEEQVDLPLFWKKNNSEQFERFTLSGWRPVILDAPVCHVSFYEAEAFARFKNLRLPTEQEWEVAAHTFQKENVSINDAGKGILDPTVTEKATHDFLGNVWEWTNSAYLPYPGYKPWTGGVGEYNGKFMINQMVLRGGSCASAEQHLRNTYRNFFHPHLRWQFTGIRLAK